VSVVGQAAIDPASHCLATVKDGLSVELEACRGVLVLFVDLRLMAIERCRYGVR